MSVTNGQTQNLDIDRVGGRVNWGRAVSKADWVEVRNSSEYQLVGSQHQLIKPVKAAPKVRQNRFKCSATLTFVATPGGQRPGRP